MYSNQAHKMLRGCLSKKKYVSLKAAKKGIKRMRDKYGKEARAYTCDCCGHYHLTTKNGDRMNEKEEL
ncbi:hypothetical protein KAR91_21425 [Candidatus Pacearchaeota archaeon]|nr:hypothetical protein [Candidatus Pacearchaeota archaeon]